MGDNKPDEANKPWMIRDVPEEVRRDVKIYAIQHGVTVAEALEALVRQALEVQLGIVPVPSSDEPLLPLLTEGEGSLLTEEDLLLVVNAVAEVVQRVANRVMDQMRSSVEKAFADEARGDTQAMLEEALMSRETLKKQLAALNIDRERRGLPTFTLDEILEIRDEWQRTRRSRRKTKGNEE